MRGSFLFLFIFLLLSRQVFSSDDTTYVASIAYQDKELNFNQVYSGSASNEAEFNVHIPMATAGLTVVKGKWFASIKAEKDLASTATSTTETDRSRVLEPNLLSHPGGNVEVGREDLSFLVGYNVYKRLNLFVGYISGETTLSPAPFCANPLAAPPAGEAADHPDEQECSRSNRSFLQYYLGDLPEQLETPPDYYVENQPEYQQTYKEYGSFFGGSYSFPFEGYGSLSVSLAYASLSGEYSDNANDPNNGYGGSFTAFSYKGDTTGTSTALTWTGSLGDRTAYTIDVRRQAYDLEATDQTGRLSGVTLETKETMLGLSFGIQVYF